MKRLSQVFGSDAARTVPLPTFLAASPLLRWLKAALLDWEIQ